MEKMEKNFGFGCLRLPMRNGEVDYYEFSNMVDIFLDNGFKYFDTASGYINGKSEIAIRECLTKRYRRDQYMLANKLSTQFFERKQDIRPLFNKQLNSCGTDYFDVYLMHSQNSELYPKYKEAEAYEMAQELKMEGKIKNIGISFHDKAYVLERILDEQPHIDVVQIQFNYVDYEDPGVESRACYEVCRKYNKPIIVMEPTKGGNLANLPPKAQEIIDSRNLGSAASYAIRFAGGFEGVIMVLSGMSNMKQMKDNISYMKDFKPLSEDELKVVNQICKMYKEFQYIQCTNCGYCIANCPKGISIPDLFACMNAKMVFEKGNAYYYYHHVHTINKGKASDCIRCGKCEYICPQHLKIRDLLLKVAIEFEK